MRFVFVWVASWCTVGVAETIIAQAALEPRIALPVVCAVGLEGIAAKCLSRAVGTHAIVVGVAYAIHIAAFADAKDGIVGVAGSILGDQ